VKLKGTCTVDPRYPLSESARRSVIIVSQRLYGTGQVAATYPLFVSAMRVQRTKQHSLPRRSGLQISIFEQKSIMQEVRKRQQSS